MVVTWGLSHHHSWIVRRETYEAKWRPGSAEDLATPPHLPADIEPALAASLGELARAAFRLFGCRDYACVDIRLDADGAPMILEINPNPDLNPSASFTQALCAAGISYVDFICALVQRAVRSGLMSQPALVGTHVPA